MTRGALWPDGRSRYGILRHPVGRERVNGFNPVNRGTRLQRSNPVEKFITRDS